MVKLSESARFNRGSLLGEMANASDVPARPGDNYVEAARMVWLAMHSESRRSTHPDDGPMKGDGDRPGQLVSGLGPYQAIRLIWPDIPNVEIKRSGPAIRRVFTHNHAATCIEQGRAHGLSRWWVADEWVAPKFEKSKSRTYKKKRKALREDSPVTTEYVRESKRKEVEEISPGFSESTGDMDMDIIDNAMHMFRSTVERLVDKATEELRVENKELRERLARVQEVLQL